MNDVELQFFLAKDIHPYPSTHPRISAVSATGLVTWNIERKGHMI